MPWCGCSTLVKRFLRTKRISLSGSTQNKFRSAVNGGRCLGLGGRRRGIIRTGGSMAQFAVRDSLQRFLTEVRLSCEERMDSKSVADPVDLARAGLPMRESSSRLRGCVQGTDDEGIQYAPY